MSQFGKNYPYRHQQITYSKTVYQPERRTCCGRTKEKNFIAPPANFRCILL